ncbi:MAG: transferase [Peptococcaceae bacterium]|nr:transferase [Peptococcaceae bacterium]
MIRYSPVTSWNHVEKLPVVHELAYVDPGAVLIGEVTVEKDAVILPGVVIRADEGCPIVIGKGTNVQDGVIMHALKGSGIDVGRHCSIAHGAVVHGPCRIGDNSFVGFNAVLLKAVLGKNCFVSHGAMVIGVEVPDGKFVPTGQVIDSREKVLALADITPEMAGFAEEVREVNEELLRGYRKMAVREAVAEPPGASSRLAVCSG